MDEGELERFCNELAPRLETARALEAELDRELARKFNAFDYLRTDEMGLSKVIASLLNPKGTHGQGDLFLRLLLDKLKFNEGVDPQNINVRTELSIDSRRRLDVTVQMDNTCLAIENKPYAGDQPNQVKDYLVWLHKKYADFRLIYLSPNGEPPSEESVAPTRLEKDYGETFRIVPYHKVEGDWQDNFDRFRDSFGLTDWLKECRMHCDIERLRWFLREAETFCERNFGDDTMSTGEAETVKKFVLKDSRNVATAAAIHGAWDSIKDDVLSKFIGLLKDRIEEELSGMIVKSNYGQGKLESWVVAYNDNWANHWIEIGNHHAGPSSWCIGIVSEAQPKEIKEQRKPLEQALRAALGDGRRSYGDGGYDYSWWNWVDDLNSGSLVPDIYPEVQKKGGETEIINNIVLKFIDVATSAEPILNDIKGT